MRCTTRCLTGRCLSPCSSMEAHDSEEADRLQEREEGLLPGSAGWLQERCSVLLDAVYAASYNMWETTYDLAGRLDSTGEFNPLDSEDCAANIAACDQLLAAHLQDLASELSADGSMDDRELLESSFPIQDAIKALRAGFVALATARASGVSW